MTRRTSTIVRSVSRTSFAGCLCLAAFAAGCRSAAVPASPFPPSPVPGAPPLAEYAELRDRTLAEGREVAALVMAQNVTSLFARFSPAARNAVPIDRLMKTLAATFSPAQAGARLDEGALIPSRDNRSYAADYRWGARVLTMAIGFDASGAVSSFRLQPRNALPPDPRERYKTRALLSLPFDGTWWVFWGGLKGLENYHIVASDQRHAVDFVVWRDGGTFQGEGSLNAHYWAWGQPVRAPADAVVVDAIGDVRDNQPRIEPTNLLHPAGNHIILDFGTSEFAVIAHLQQGSLRVRPGQTVKRGDLLGLCGNSGNSSEPHIHMHLQDRKELSGNVLGLPMSFTRYVADESSVARGSPVQGQFVRRAP